MQDFKPSYEDLENKITEYKKQIEEFQLNSSIQNKEKEKRAEELIAANVELTSQNKEK